MNTRNITYLASLYFLLGTGLAIANEKECTPFRTYFPHGFITDIKTNDKHIYALEITNWLYTSENAMNWTALRLPQGASKSFILDDGNKKYIGRSKAKDSTITELWSSDMSIGYWSPVYVNLEPWANNKDKKDKRKHPWRGIHKMIWNGKKYIANPQPQERLLSKRKIYKKSSSLDKKSKKNILYPLGISDDAIHWEQTELLPHVSDIMWDGNDYYALTMHDGVYQSNSGMNWQKVGEVEQGGGNPRAIRFLDNQYIIVGDEGRILKSKNAKEWHTVHKATKAPYSLLDVTSYKDTVVAVGTCGYIITSHNKGENWNEIKLPYEAWLSSIEYFNGLFVAAGYYEKTRGYKDRDTERGEVMFVSKDGLEWSDISGNLKSAKQAFISSE